MGRANRDKPYDLTQAWMGNVETSAADAYNEYGPADALTLWVRMKPDTPVDLGPNKLSPTYTSANTRSNKRLIGNVRYDAATFSDSTGYNAEVYGASGELDMTLAPDTASYNGSDLPFSISMWVNFQDLASIQYLFTKNSPDVPAGAHLPAYYAYTTSLQDGSPVRIGFYLGDDDQTAYNHITVRAAGLGISAADPADSTYQEDVWHHLAFTYDGSDNATTGVDGIYGMKIYLNGAEVKDYSLRMRVGSYQGMVAAYSKPLHIGAYEMGTDELDGQVAEFAAWKNKELTALEVRKIYDTTRVGYQVTSGFLNNPPRTLLQERDCHTGSYPATARTGDPDFTGRGSVAFNDTKTVVFFSSYAKAQIRFKGLPRDLSRSSAPHIDLTGSKAGSRGKARFEFQRGQYQQAYAHSTLVDISAALYRPLTTNDVAYEFTKAVNTANLGMTAHLSGTVVELRQSAPMTGSQAHGNLILTGTAIRDPHRLPVEVRQFYQVGPQNYRYPLLLSTASVHSTDRIATPNTLPNLEAPGIMMPGVSDVGLKFTPGESLTPFDDARVYIDPEDAFYTQGTAPSILPGFDQRLSDKTILTFDVSAATPTEVYFSTGSSSDPESNLPNPDTATVASRYTPACIQGRPSNWDEDTGYITIPLINAGASYEGRQMPASIDANGAYVELYDTSGVLQETYTAAASNNVALKEFARNGTNDQETAENLVYVINRASAYFWALWYVDVASSKVPVQIYNKAESVLYMPDSKGAPGSAAWEAVNTKAAVWKYSTGWAAVTDYWTATSFKVTHEPNSGLAYYNFVGKKWEIIGSAVTGSKVDYYSADSSVRTSSTLAVCPPQVIKRAWRFMSQSTSTPTYLPTYLHLDKLNKSIGSPSNHAGFPLAEQFNATGSQLLELSGTLTAPFLLQKVQLKFSASLTNYPFFDSTNPALVPAQAQNASFMLLLQRETSLLHNSSSGYIELVHWPGELTPGWDYITSGTVFPYTNDKRVVWQGRMGLLAAGSDETQISTKYPGLYSSCDLWEVATDSDAHPDGSVTGSFMLRADCRTPAPVPRPAPAYALRGNRNSGGGFRAYFGRTQGGRDLYSLDDGRSYVRAAPGGEVIGLTTAPAASGAAGSQYGDPGISIYKKDSEVSPFLLLPTDKLILAYVNQQMPGTGTASPVTYPAGRSESETARAANVLATGRAELTLFGDMVRDAKPISPSLNQPLTSDAIHEDVRDDVSPYGEALCLDQFIVEPLTSYRGSYLDNLIGGGPMFSGAGTSIFSVPSNEDLASGRARRVVSSVVDGEAGITGSLQRFVRLVNDDRNAPKVGGGSTEALGNATPPAEIRAVMRRVYYDSTVPNLRLIVSATAEPMMYGASAGAASPGGSPPTANILSLAGLGVQNNPKAWNASSQAWPFRFPFDGAYARLPRFSTIQGIMLDPDGSGQAVDTVLYYTLGADLNESGKVYAILANDGSTTLATGGAQLVLKGMFGIGDYYKYPISLEKDTGAGGATTAYGNMILLRGFKYGLINAVPMSPSAVFRADTCGQFRDMLEPLPQARYYEDDGAIDITDPPVFITFYSRDGSPGVSPDTTNSQNLDMYATSSVPYFDLEPGIGPYPYGRDRSTVQPDLDPDEDVELIYS